MIDRELSWDGGWVLFWKTQTLLSCKHKYVFTHLEIWKQETLTCNIFTNTESHTQCQFNVNSCCWFMRIIPSFIVACLEHWTPSLLPSTRLQSYSGAIVASVTYYKQHTFREKAVIVQKCGTNGFLTLLYAFLQCQPLHKTLKALLNWSLAFIQYKSYVCNWALALYLFSPLPPPCMPCFIWVHSSNGLSNGSKILFFSFPEQESLFLWVM